MPEVKCMTNDQKLRLAKKVVDILNKEASGDQEAMAFAIKTAAGLIWGHDYQLLVKL